jgi:FkbM family methyltransferase
MSYHSFINRIDEKQIHTIFELGSRDLIDAIKLSIHFQNSMIYAFECNPDCLVECSKNISVLRGDLQKRIHLVEKAISLNNGLVLFYPFDLKQYDNMGASSMLKIDFSKRSQDDPDYNRPNPQTETVVLGTRLDTYMQEHDISNIDLLCIDLQGYELNAIKSLGSKLRDIKYIITECSIQSTYTDGTTFKELSEYLGMYGFTYISSNRFGDEYPDLSLVGFSEFDALFINKSNVQS